MSQRILLIVETMCPLGPAHQMSLLARNLVEAGFEIHIAVINDRQPSPFLVPENCQVHYLEIQKRDWMGWRKLQLLAKSIQPSICHDWSAYGITRAAILDCFPHVSSHFTNSNDHHSLSRMIGRAPWVVGRKSIEPTLHVASHPIIAEGLARRAGAVEQIRTIPPAVDAELTLARAISREFVLEEYRLAADSVVVGTYAPLVPATRIKDLIWAIDLISCIRDDVQLLVMGRGAQLNRLKRFLRCTAARTHVKFIGRPTDSMRVLAGLDVYWNSHLQWPTPQSLLNAMQLGIPSVSVHGPETDGIVIHQTTGFSVNFGARDEFARWTKYLIEQKDSAAQLASQGQQHVIQKFSCQSMVDAYREVYQSCLA